MPLRELARERRSLHAEGLCALLATVGLVTAAGLGLPSRALAVPALLYMLHSAAWVVRLVRALGRSCPRCGDLFFYSLERLLYSLPYLSRRCASCGESLPS
jgi:hypothetical protein